MTLLTILMLISFIVFIIYTYKHIKKSDSFIEKLLDILLLIIIFTPVMVYYLDYFNVLSHLDIKNNINEQNWLLFVSSYSSSLVSAIFNSSFLYIFTKMQLDRNYLDSKKRDAENERLKNLPLIKYSFTFDETYCKTPILIKSKNNIGKPKIINFKLKNIGLNSIRNFNIKISGNDILKNQKFFSNIQNPLSVNEEQIIPFLIDIDTGNNKLIFTVEYQDLLFNCYRQIITLDFEGTNIY